MSWTRRFSVQRERERAGYTISTLNRNREKKKAKCRKDRRWGGYYVTGQDRTCFSSPPPLPQHQQPCHTYFRFFYPNNGRGDDTLLGSSVHSLTGSTGSTGSTSSRCCVSLLSSSEASSSTSSVRSRLCGLAWTGVCGDSARGAGSECD